MAYFKLITVLIAGTQQPQFVPVHTSLRFDEPVQAVFDGVRDDVVYVVEKDGIVRMVSLQKEAAKKPIYLNIRDRVGVTHDEEGLLSLVFHPEFEKNGEMFVWYSAQRPKRGVLSRFVLAGGDNKVKPDTEKIILEVRQPWGNHNGGTVLFGADGYLYLGIGDGGAANDPYQNGQNKRTMLGTIIRIDVDSSADKLAYAIPDDNPLVGEEGVREEIWAWGLRNPWRMSFDKQTGNLWVGDVGQNAWEEIDIVKRGENYGWNIMEGKHKFQGSDEKTSTVEPVYEYGRRQGGSITGGHVYRGKKITSLVGSYIYSDYLSRRVWALRCPTEGAEGYTNRRIAKSTPLSISSFGEMPNGEIICCGFETPYATTGKIYLLVSPPESDSNSTTDNIR